MTDRPIAALQPASFARDFWVRFAVPNGLMAVMWVLLEGLTFPDYVAAFYVISIGAVPIAFRIGILAGWQFAARAWRSASTAERAFIPVILVFLLPALFIFAWGLYCFIWLVSLLLNGGF